MEFLKEAIASRNIFAWIILVLLLILAIKVIKSLGKVVLLLILVVSILFVGRHFFPDLLQPVVDFVNGSWMNSGG